MDTSHSYQAHAFPRRRASTWLSLVLVFVTIVGFGGAPALSAANSAALVKDINPTKARFDYGLGLSDLVTAGNHVFFRGGDPQNGNDLWSSDGTSDGTRLLYDIAAGTESASIAEMVDVGGKLFFSAGEPFGLWVSDGTTARTERVKGAFYGPGQLTNVNGKLYFMAQEAASPWPMALWKSDGSAAGTVKVTEIEAASLTAAGTTRVISAGPSELIGAEELENVAGTLYFHGTSRVDTMNFSVGLWKSDGSAPGTIEIKSFYKGTSTLYSVPRQLFGVGSHLFFAGPDSKL